MPSLQTKYGGSKCRHCERSEAIQQDNDAFGLNHLDSRLSEGQFILSPSKDGNDVPVFNFSLPHSARCVTVIKYGNLDNSGFTIPAQAGPQVSNTQTLTFADVTSLIKAPLTLCPERTYRAITAASPKTNNARVTLACLPCKYALVNAKRFFDTCIPRIALRNCQTSFLGLFTPSLVA